MDRDQCPERRLAALDLLARERLGDVVEAGAAVLLRDHDAEDPELGHSLDQLHVETVRDVVLDGDREDALVHEGAHGVLDQLLLVGEREVHAREPTLTAPRAPPALVAPKFPLCQAGSSAGSPSIETAFFSRT